MFGKSVVGMLYSIYSVATSSEAR